MKPLCPSSGELVRVFIAGDNALSCESAEVLLGKESDIYMAGQTGFGPETADRIGAASPDVAVLVLNEGGVSMELIKAVHGFVPSVQLLAVFAVLSLESVFKMLQAGTKGCILADCLESDLARAVRAVRQGRRYLSQAVSNALVDDYVKKSCSAPEPKDPLLALNMREKEILQLVVEGKGSGAIAATLNLSVSTVNTYRCRVLKKLGLRDLTELVRFAIRNGLTPLSSYQTIKETARSS